MERTNKDEQGNIKPESPLGVYTHQESGKSLEALSVPSADAFIHMGFAFDAEKTEKAYAAQDEADQDEEVGTEPATPSLNELRARAKELGLSAGGSKEDLTQRIAEQTNKQGE